ncbi:MAG: CHRD domain-containing protein [Anaerolineae bacterium]|nr:CHRD domain-containing protein [Anaerolineae bacterium]
MKRLVVLALVVVSGLVGTGIVSAHGGRPLSAALSGANEVAPVVGDPDGSGFAEVTLNQGQGQVCFSIHVEAIDAITAAHIHSAPAGVNGPVVVDFSGQLNGCTTGVNADLIKAIRQNPENYYVNVHTTAHRAGAIRGQLSK